MAHGEHWQATYLTRSPGDVGWYERDPIMSRRFAAEAVARGAESLIDIGGGASSLVDHVLDLGIRHVAVLDISAAGLALARSRLGDRAQHVQWIVGDVTTLDDVGRFDIWHDRAVFHFLTDERDRQR